MGLVLRLIERSDQRSLSRLAGRVADSRLLAPLLKPIFCGAYRPRLAEAEHPARHYKTLNELFTRRLAPGARPLEAAPIVCPADGAFGASGAIAQGTLIQAKGKRYALSALLAGEGALAASLEGGSFATIYLSPRDYHRFHAPCDGRLTRTARVDGRLLPVNAGAVGSIDDLFARNERTIYVIEDAAGVTGALVIFVAVAAFLVSGIVVTRQPGPLGRGDELGYFRFGSTVIVLAGPGLPPLDPNVAASARVGQGIGG